MKIPKPPHIWFHRPSRETLAEAAWNHYALAFAMRSWQCPLCGQPVPWLNPEVTDHVQAEHPATATPDTIAALSRIPTLAVEVFLTWGHPNPSGQLNDTPARTTSPKVPADLTAWDGLRPDEHGLLAQMTLAVRAVWEECRETHPLPSLANPPTWLGECDWLLAASPAWQSDPWLTEYVTDTVRDVRRALERATRTPPPLRLICPRAGCGWPVHAEAGGSYYRCEADHIIDHAAELKRLGQIQEMTASELAQHFGVTDRTLRRWRAANLVRPVGKLGREPLYSVLDVRRARERVWRGSAGNP